MTKVIYYLVIYHLVIYWGIFHFLAERSLHFAGNNLEAVRIEQFAEIALFGRGVLAGKEPVVQTNLGIDGTVALHPVDSRFGLAVSALGSGFAVQVHVGINSGDITLRVLVATGSANDIGILQAHLAPAGAQAEEILGSVLHEVGALYPQFLAERHLARTQCLDSIDVLCHNRLGAFVVVQDKTDGVEDGANTRCLFLEVLADSMLEQSYVNHALYLGVTDLVDESADSGRSISASAQPADCRHARVVPTANQSLLDQLEHLALGHHGVGDIQAVELELMRTAVLWHSPVSRSGQVQHLVNEIVVKGTVHDKLEGADRVRDALEIVALTMCKIVHRIHVPFASGAVVWMRGDDTIHDRVAEVHVGVRHVNLGTEHHLALLNLSALHGFEQA